MQRRREGGGGRKVRTTSLSKVKKGKIPTRIISFVLSLSS